MNLDSLRSSLLEIAKQLRPLAQSAFVPLTKIASEWGIKVELVLYSGEKRRDAQSDVSDTRPRILIYRKSDTNGVVGVTPEREHLLRPRERFSFAHELGHCIAFKEYNFLPIVKEVARAEYRQQERCMDEFAEALLVPQWLGRKWLNSIPDNKPVAPNLLRSWASNQCGVSNEVVANALTKIEPNIGFLKVAEARRIATNQKIFVVYYSVHGAHLELPKMHSYIDDQSLVQDMGEKVAGNRIMKTCYLGRFKCENLSFSWQQVSSLASRRRREFSSTIRLTERSFWFSARICNRLDAVEDSLHSHPQQLSLFD